MADRKLREDERAAATGGSEEEARARRGRCRQGEHEWVAAFRKNGRLAFWKCAGCDEQDREYTRPVWPEVGLAEPSGWVKDPPRLIVAGARPLVSTRRWATAEGQILVEGDPCGIDHLGERIPGLERAWDYALEDEHGESLEAYVAERTRHAPHGDTYTLTRFAVVGDALLRFESIGHEDSMYEMPSATQPSRTTVLAGLKLL